ncbi:hypothetical protein AB0K09_05020 [Streptomyces sp. NPDC049577]|uniref:hypothetical protein n=1 Tax=Streptomyces sp. NPDC049577 TaxID=3155153 RepID=UPI0034383905
MATPPVGPVSPAINQPVGGLFTTSDFESKSHAELRAMVAHASPEHATELHRKLAHVSEATEKIATRLREHMAGVHWESDAGEAFRTWGSDMANATLGLSDFAGTAATWMGHAAETLTQVHRLMPEVSSPDSATLAAYHQAHPGQVGAVPQPLVSDQSGGLSQPGPTQKQAYEAQQRLEHDRLEAARLMRKLAESYAWSAHNIQGAKAPVFAPLEPSMLPDLSDIEATRRIPDGGDVGASPGPSPFAHGAGGSGPYASSVYEPARSTAHDSTPPLGHEARETSPGSRLPDVPTTSRIDGAATMPHVPAGGHGTEPPPLPGGGTPRHTVPLPPPPVALPADVGRGVPAGPGRGASGPSRGANGVPANALGRVPSGRPGISTPTGRIPSVPADGIVGGRPSPRGAGQPNRSLPRGTVIGAEPGQGSRQVGNTMAPGFAGVPAAGGSAGRQGTGNGRRLATEPGGVVGGRPSGQGRQGADRPFTPGGTGLAGERGSNSEHDREGRRPDYLSEDEQTWTSHRRVVPPVID